MAEYEVPRIEIIAPSIGFPVPDSTIVPATDPGGILKRLKSTIVV